MMKWSKIPGSISGTISLVDGEYYLNDKELPAKLKKQVAFLFPNVTELEFTLEFESSGFSSPASMYGGADHTGWPAEFEDERIVVFGTIGDVSKPLDPDKPMKKEMYEHLGELLADEIQEIELDLSEPEPD